MISAAERSAAELVALTPLEELRERAAEVRFLLLHQRTLLLEATCGVLLSKPDGASGCPVLAFLLLLTAAAFHGLIVPAGAGAVRGGAVRPDHPALHHRPRPLPQLVGAGPRGGWPGEIERLQGNMFRSARLDACAPWPWHVHISWLRSCFALAPTLVDLKQLRPISQAGLHQ